MEDKQLKKELGFKIREVYSKKNKLVVEVEEPEPTLSIRTFSFGPDMTETKKYVENGEVIEEPRWKLRLQKKLEKEYGDEKIDVESAKSFKGERISTE